MAKRQGKVDRSKYSRATDSILSILALNVFLKSSTQTKAKKQMDQLLPLLKKELDAYNVLLAEALSRDKITIEKKNQKKKEVIIVLNKCANVVDDNSNGNPAFVLECGFTPQDANNTPSTDLEPPTLTKLKSNGEVGEVMYAMEFAEGNIVRTVEVEIIVDGENAFDNRFLTSKKGVMKKLPSLQNVTFRFRTIGTNDNKSEWSGPITIPVL